MIRVAIIEDLDSYRHAMEALLNHAQGFACCGAFADSESALVALPQLLPDVVLVDIHLPAMNGIELVQHIREAIPQTLCMMCTAYDEDEDVFKALEAGAHGYILKSTAPAKILEAVQELTEGGSPMSNEIARKVVRSFQRPLVVKPDYELTKREKEILQLLSQGMLYKEIAAKLFISMDTVRRHCFNIYTKLHVKNKTEAINKFFGNPHR